MKKNEISNKNHGGADNSLDSVDVGDVVDVLERETLAKEKIKQNVSRETFVLLEKIAALHGKQRLNHNIYGDKNAYWHRHVLDSVQIFNLLPSVVKNGEGRLLDIGTGAGFPGLILYAMGARNAMLVDARKKKIELLQEIMEALSLKVELHWGRIEHLAPQKADTITARALAPLPKLCAYAQRHLLKKGIAILHKGASAVSELQEANNSYNFVCEKHASITNEAASILVLSQVKAK